MRLCVRVSTRAGDSVFHLQWRLHGGEAPSGVGARLAIVLIGTNDASEEHFEVLIWPASASSCIIRLSWGYGRWGMPCAPL